MKVRVTLPMRRVAVTVSPAFLEARTRTRVASPGMIVRIMGEAHPVQAGGLHDFGVFAVHGVGNGVPDVGPGLVTVRPDQFEVFAVEECRDCFCCPP